MRQRDGEGRREVGAVSLTTEKKRRRTAPQELAASKPRQLTNKNKHLVSK